MIVRSATDRSDPICDVVMRANFLVVNCAQKKR